MANIYFINRYRRSRSVWKTAFAWSLIVNILLSMSLFGFILGK